MGNLKKVAGLSLIELLIAMALGVTLLSGVLVIYSNQLKTTLLIDAQSRMQESANAVFQLVGQQLQNIGFSGCRVLSGNNFLNKITPSDPDFGNYVSIEGLNADQAQAWNANADNASDAIRLQHLELLKLSFTTDITSSDRQFTVTDASTISPNDALYITDCVNASLFQANSVSDNNIGVNADITPGNSTFLADESQLFRVATTTYSIRPSATLNNANQQTNSLFMDDEEIIEGVDAMYFFFGLDESNNNWADHYVTTTNLDVNNLHLRNNIVSVRMVIRVHSVNTVDSEGTLSRVYVRTFQVRNKELERNL